MLTQLLNQPDKADLKPLRMVVVTNITLEPYFTPLMKQALDSFGLRPEIVYFPLNSDFSSSDVLRKADYIIVWPFLRALMPDYESLDLRRRKQGITEINILFHTVYQSLQSRTNAPIYWMGLEDYQGKTHHITGGVRKKQEVAEACNQVLLDKELQLIDMKRIVAEVGIAKSYSEKYYQRWTAPYSEELIKSVINKIIGLICADRGLSLKCLVLDCDGVLWGGILSEDGIEGIVLSETGKGCVYQEFQRFAIQLAQAGILIAVCTKNDPKDVFKVLRGHSGMLIREKHLACIQAGWDNKPEALIKISNTLGISLDSMAFVDDSANEIDAVAKLLPEVTAIMFEPQTVYGKLSSCFSVNAVFSDAAKKRLKSYQAQNKRKKLIESAPNYAAYLQTLQQKVEIHAAEPHEYIRIAELSQRTNRCTNGARFTLSQIKSLANESDTKLFAVYVKDRLGDSGLVGVVMVANDTLELFCLSCRALGRGIEEEMLSVITAKRYQFKNTGKNENMQALLKEKYGGAENDT